MVGYFYSSKETATLHICTHPYAGHEFQVEEVITVADKREARAICKARGVKPWNF